MGVRELYDAYGARLLCYPLQGYSTPTATQPPAWRHRSETLLMDGQIKTHGLPGALAFLYLNDILREYPAAAHQQSAGLFCLEWASLAILMHDLQKIYVGSAGANQPPENSQLRVSFRRDPLSFLITLVDQIQDFCRPNATFVPSGDKVRLSYPHACHAVDVTARPSGPMIITYCYQQRADYDKNTFEHKPKAQREYFDPNVGYVDWTGLPINSVRLLTRYEP
jgi:hypothetical protein